MHLGRLQSTKENSTPNGRSLTPSRVPCTQGARVQCDQASHLGVPRTVSAWQSHWRQLALQGSAAESDCQREMQSTRALTREEIDDLRTAKGKSEDERTRYERELWAGLAKVQKHVRVLPQNLQFAPGQEGVGAMVRGAEHALRIFGEQQRLQSEELAAEELSLGDMLQSALTRFEGWCSHDSALSTPIKLSQKRSSSFVRSSSKNAGGKGGCSDPGIAPLRQELDQIASKMDGDGGSTGGWTCDDHDTFLRLLVKFKRRTGSDFLSELQQLLPHMAHEGLIEHVAWSLRNEGRELRKRELLEQWRDIRATKTASTPSDNIASPQAMSAKRRQQTDARSRELHDAAERRRVVSEWRSQRREQLEAQEEVLKCRQREAQERKLCEQQIQRQKTHLEVERFQQQRQEEKRMRETSHRAAVTASAQPSQEEKDRIERRNAHLLERRNAHQQTRRQQRFEPPVRPLAGTYLHIESRLRSHTEEYVERVRDLKVDIEDAGAESKYGLVPGNFGHQVMVRTLRSSPSWRGRFGA